MDRDYKKKIPNFEFIMLSHWHDDHFVGLENLIYKYGTNNVYYPKTSKKHIVKFSLFTNFLNHYKKKNAKLIHQSIDKSKIFNNFGDVNIEVLWPPSNRQYSHENNNSIVMKLTLNKVDFILTGDAENPWRRIAGQIPNNTKFFKVPHHGSVNGTFQGKKDNTYWLDQLNGLVSLGISCHPYRNYNHPHTQVLDEFKKKNMDYYRTDINYHLSFSTDGNTINKIDVKYSRI
jgi:competence protein ComEC